MSVHRGMVTVEGVSYRIQKVGRETYDVHRILDDQLVGTFQRTPTIQVLEDRTPMRNVFQIAQTAVRNARVSWTGRLDLP